MSLMWRCCALMMLVSILVLGGCAYRVGGRDYADAGWTAAKGSAGKVLLVVAGNPENEFSARHVEEVRGIASTTLAGLPNTSVLEREPATVPASSPATATAPAPVRWSPTVSDVQAVSMGKERGADSVCVLTVADYSGMFMIGLMPLPGWSGTTRVMYDLRLIDVRTGALLAHALRYSGTGGQFQIRTPEDMKRDLAAALRRDLTPPVKN